MSTQTGSLDLKSAKAVYDIADDAKTDANAAVVAAKADVTLYGTCQTAAGTGAKVINLQTALGRTAPTALRAGMTILVSFANANTYDGALSLNVKDGDTSIGSASIYASGAVISSTNQMLWGAGAAIEFAYNGTYWIPVGHPCAYYGTSATAATTAGKVSGDVGNGECVICKGTTIGVKFTDGNTADQPTMNINSTGSKAVYTQNEAKAYWSAGATILLTFDGQNWRVSSEPIYASQVIVGNAAKSYLYLDEDELAMYTQAATPAVYMNTAGRYNSPWFYINNPILSSHEAFSVALEKQSDGEYAENISIVVTDEAGEHLEYAWGSTTPYILSEDTTVASGKTYYEWTVSNDHGSFVAVTPSSGADPSEEGWYETAILNAAGSTSFSVAYDGNHSITWTNKKSTNNSDVNCYVVYYVNAPAPYVSIGKRDWPNPGYENTGAGPLSLTCGQWLLAEGKHAVAIGQLNSAGGNSAFVGGADNQVDGYASMGFGIGLRVPVDNQVAMGSYNVIDPAYDPNNPDFGYYAFLIGVGVDENHRANGLTVDWGGNVEAGGALIANTPAYDFSEYIMRNPSISNGAAFGFYDTASRTVRINFRCSNTDSAGPIATGTTLFTVPDEFKPVGRNRYGSVMEMNSNNVAGVGRCSINTSGEIKQGASSSARYVIGIIEYVL